MTEWHTRYGGEYTGSRHIHVIDKDRAYFVQPRICNRCGGAGRSEAWRYTGYTCYDCGGAGTLGPEKIKLYTPEKIEKLNRAQEKAQATRAAKRAKKEAKEQAEREAKRETTIAAMRETYPEACKILDGKASHHFLAEIQRKYREGYELTERMAEAVVEVAAKQAEFDARDAKIREYESRGGQVEAGRIEVTAALIAVKEYDDLYSYTPGAVTYKALFVTNKGYKIFGTVPSGVSRDDRGEVFRFRATIQPSDDPGFGYYKRPYGAEIIEEVTV
jgi:hypothetical protein